MRFSISQTFFDHVTRHVISDHLIGSHLLQILHLGARQRFLRCADLLQGISYRAKAGTGKACSHKMGARAKASYVKEIARMALEGVVPGKGQIKRMSDDEIIERLSQIKGVGRWTVEMLLIFSLGRPDVLPVDDFGIRKGFGVAFRKRKMPEPEQVLKHRERWKPYRSIASWYLWRAADMAGEKA